MPQQLSKKVLSWATDLDGETIAQASRTASLPFIEGHVALMPDAHLGLGATVGSVVPTTGAIIPSCVGVDIGCGMIAVKTNYDVSDMPDDLRNLLNEIEQSVPAGVGRGHSRGYKALKGDLWYRDNPNESVKEFDLGNRAVEQFGTLGSGNHFVEVCTDPEDNVWVVLHSGSRGVGNKLASRHIKIAKGLMKQMFITLPDPDLAYFVKGTSEFHAYMRDLEWAQNYALANRETMMDAVLEDVENEVGKQLREETRINCHHNYTALEHHRGKDIYVTRKGAIRAREGDLGIIPGSMGTNTFIVRGLGNAASYDSSAHGAGRRMSRRAAKAAFTDADLAEAMAGKTWLDDRAGSLIDEIPGAYKDIHKVMVDQADLVEIVTELTQILNYKGT